MSGCCWFTLSCAVGVSSTNPLLDAQLSFVFTSPKADRFCVKCRHKAHTGCDSVLVLVPGVYIMRLLHVCSDSSDHLLILRFLYSCGPAMYISVCWALCRALF